MKILYVASEATPYAASGGLGDVMGALPKSIASDYPGDEVSVIVPLYDTMKSEHRASLEKVIDLSFRYSWRNTGATVYKLVNSGVNYYFVENHYYFDRGRLYGEFDDAERFAFFSTAVIEFMLAGATAVEVGAANLVNPYACRDIIEDLPRVMKKYNITSLKDIIGGAH